MMENKTKIDLKNTSIFITGAAGFIGSNLAKRILTTVEGAKVVGLDNMNHYYDVRLKEARLDELNKFENFSFVKGNLADKETITTIFEQYKPQIVVNLGAQAGVRYSITNPDAYVEANLIGFYTVLIRPVYSKIDYGVDLVVSDATPDKYIWLFRHASFVVTNSFHRSRSYQYLTEHHFQVIVQNYQQAYFTKLFTSDTPEMIWKRLEEHRPKNFRGRPFGVGDVIVINQQGEITAYFVDKDSLVVVAGFIRSSSSGILVTLDTKNLFIDGCAGTWMATEECVVESQHFFLMQHEVYKEKAPNVIVDASGKLVSTEIRKGLDEDARKKILDYLHPPLMEKPMNQKPSLHQMEHYQKFYENGEYVRAVESTTEQNYNMIDGCANNLPKPRIINGRESVLDKLRIRQMAREKQKSSQEQSADMERNRK